MYHPPSIPYMGSISSISVVMIYQVLIIYIPIPHLLKRFDWSEWIVIITTWYGLCIIPDLSPIWVVYEVYQVVMIYQVLIIYIPIPHLFKRFDWSERIVIITTWYGLCIIPQASPIWVVYQVYQVVVIYQILIIYIPTPHLFKRFDWSRMDCDHHHFGLCIIPQVSPIWVVYQVYQVVVIYHEYHHQSLDEASDPTKSHTTPLGRFESTSWSWCGKRWEIRSNCPRCAVTKSGWVLAKKSMGMSYGNMGIKPGRRACAGLIYSGWWLGTMEFYDFPFSWE